MNTWWIATVQHLNCAISAGDWRVPPLLPAGNLMGEALHIINRTKPTKWLKPNQTKRPPNPNPTLYAWCGGLERWPWVGFLTEECTKRVNLHLHCRCRVVERKNELSSELNKAVTRLRLYEDIFARQFLSHRIWLLPACKALWNSAQDTSILIDFLYLLC